MSSSPKYLEPYVNAAARFGGGFGSLLWATPTTQAARFDAICRLEQLDGKTVLDVGCGRADLLDHCAERKITIRDYVGIEAMPALAEVARAKPYPNVKIISDDFVERPVSMFVGAEIVVISGALNTLDTQTFYTTIRRAFDASAGSLVVNFLDSPFLAAASFLTWHRREDVLEFASKLSTDVRILHDYLDGDSTLAIRKEDAS